MYICIRRRNNKQVNNDVKAPPVRRAVFLKPLKTNKMKNTVLIDFEMRDEQLQDLTQRIEVARAKADESLNFENRIQFILYLHDQGLFKTREEMLMCTALMYS